MNAALSLSVSLCLPRCLTCIHPDVCGQAIGALDGAAAVVRAMRAHPSCAQLQQYGCWVLDNLAIDAPSRDAIARLGPTRTCRRRLAPVAWVHASHLTHRHV